MEDLRKVLREAPERVEGFGGQSSETGEIKASLEVQIKELRGKIAQLEGQINEGNEGLGITDDEVISPIDLRDRRGEILNRVLDEGKTFIVIRKNQPLARIVPLDSTNIITKLDGDQLETNINEAGNLDIEFEVIAPVTLKDERGRLLSELEKGKRFIIARRGKPVGVLVAPGDALPLELPEQLNVLVAALKNLS